MLFESKKAGEVDLQVSRYSASILLLSCLFIAQGVNAANRSNPGQELVPPPPPIAIDLGGGLSTGLDYSGVNLYPGTYSRFSNIYSGYSNSYSAGGASSYNMSQAQNSASEAMRQYTKAFDIDLNSSDASSSGECIDTQWAIWSGPTATSVRR